MSFMIGIYITLLGKSDFDLIEMTLDLSAGSQSYIEDCENCCHPIAIDYEVEENSLISFEANRTE